MNRSTPPTVLIAAAVAFALAGPLVDAEPRQTVVNVAVLDGQGDPLPRAEYEVTDADGTTVARSVTDESGMLVAFLTPLESYRLSVSLDGFLDVRLPELEMRDDHPEAMHLEVRTAIDSDAASHHRTGPGPGVVQGIVFDEHGNPLPDARITILGVSNDVYPESSGAFRVALDPGRYRITISCDGYFTVEYPEVVIPKTETTIGLRIVMARDGSKTS